MHPVEHLYVILSLLINNERDIELGIVHLIRRMEDIVEHHRLSSKPHAYSRNRRSLDEELNSREPLDSKLKLDRL